MCFFLVVFCLFFFKNPLLSAGRMRFLKIKNQKKKKKNLDQFLTYKKANLGPVSSYRSLSGPPGPKSPKKSEKSLEKVSKIETVSTLFGLFRDFLGPGRLFPDFLGDFGRNCRFLSLVVVERVLKPGHLKMGFFSPRCRLDGAFPV